ncbi:MAG: DUF2318 domain-containing protein [Clostridiales bacterium]|nr:DUF2318 domain-containing protein [Clostridiales bacterium]
MGDTKKQAINKNRAQAKKKNNKILIGFGALIAVIMAFYFFNGKPDNSNINSAQKGGDITIVKNEITETAKFIPYNINGTYMELIAVKAPDGTIRTAFNTCQVCYNSGRGYYKQEGDELVCQNCGNRFKIGQVEKEKNGCNPVPILESDKTSDNTSITISEDFLNANKELFSNWKKV